MCPPLFSAESLTTIVGRESKRDRAEEEGVIHQAVLYGMVTKVRKDCPLLSFTSLVKKSFANPTGKSFEIPIRIQPTSDQILEDF